MATIAIHRLTLDPMGKYSNAVFSETTNMIKAKLYMNAQENTTKLENCLLQVECKRGPQRTISESKFNNIASMYLKIET